MFIKSMKRSIYLVLASTLLIGCQNSPSPTSAPSISQPAYTYLKPIETPLPKAVPEFVKKQVDIQKVEAPEVKEEEKESSLQPDALLKLLTKLDLLEPVSTESEALESVAPTDSLTLSKEPLLEKSGAFPFSRLEDESPKPQIIPSHALELEPEPEIDSVWISPEEKFDLVKRFPYTSSKIESLTKGFLFN